MRINLIHVDILSGAQVSGTIEVDTDSDLRKKLAEMWIFALARRDSSGAVTGGYVSLDQLSLKNLQEDVSYRPLSACVPKTQVALMRLNKE